MEDHKFYIIRIKAPQNSGAWNDVGADEENFNAAEIALDHGGALSNNVSEMVNDVIGGRGEYLDWLELDMDEIFAEEWVIYDDDAIDELQMQDFGYDDVEVIVEPSPNEWTKEDDEWLLVTET